MTKIDELLDEVNRLLAEVKPQEAEDKLLNLIATIGGPGLELWEPDLRIAIGEFLPKRRRTLLVALDRELLPAGNPPLFREDALAGTPPPGIETIRSELESELHYLSENHIFQWSTFYRDALNASFEKYYRALAGYDKREDALAGLRIAMATHAEDVFSKGAHHAREVQGSSPQVILSKSTSALQRFLDLPIEFYSTLLSSTRSDAAKALLLREITSSAIHGILEGFCAVEFDAPSPKSGADVLPIYPRSWAHTMGFMQGHDLAALMEKLEPGNFVDGVLESVSPAISAIDHVMASSRTYSPAPVLSEFKWNSKMLEISCQPPPLSDDLRTISIQCFVDPGFIDMQALNEAATRDIALLVSRIPAALDELVVGNVRFSSRVVNTRTHATTARASAAAIRDLEGAIYKRRSPRAGNTRLEWNFARDFPLHNPHMARHFIVYRESVRELLNTFERRSGVRLWCSVRRSGKTTSCLDLGATTGKSRIVSQTCDSTAQVPNESVFYVRVCDALEARRQIPETFFADLVQECSMSANFEDDRFVFVLDEYETLFKHLDSACISDPAVRYTVAQPLLNQMTSFARDNLLVLLGQQPNAHFILMDQNQLSPYVEQDAFPLFVNRIGSQSGELPNLVAKVLTDRVAFDSSFTDAIYEETSGHPFLTVNMLVDFVEWLIESGRTISSLEFSRSDFTEFSRARLVKEKLQLCAEYQFFRGAASEAMSSLGRDRTPWLYAVYSSLAYLSTSSNQESGRRRLADFFDFVNALGLDDVGLTPDELLVSGKQANFFDFDSRFVWPKIRLLGRIADSARPAIVA